MIYGMTEYALVKLIQERQGELERASRASELLRGLKSQGKNSLVAALLIALHLQR